MMCLRSSAAVRDQTFGLSLSMPGRSPISPVLAEPVEAGVGSLASLCDVPLPRAEAGVCARRRSNFLLGRQKKVTKEKATLQPASLRFAAGNLRCSRPAGSRSNSLHCVALRQSRALIRWPLRSSAHPEGHPGIGHPHGPLLRSAPNARALRAAAARPSNAMARVAVWMFGCSAPNPLLAAPASGRLRGEHARRSAHASLTDSPWLSERRAPAQSEFHGAPRNRPDAGCPFATRRGRRLGVAFSLVTFFWRRKRKLLARRATPGLRPQHRHAANQRACKRAPASKNLAQNRRPQ